MEQFGTFGQWVDGYEVDRLGVHRLTVAQKYASFDSLFTLPKKDGSRLPISGSIPWARTTLSPESDSGAGVIRWFYEGVPNEELAEVPEVYEFEGSFNQEPITSHPKIQQLLRQYRGRLDGGGVVWPAKVSGGAGGGLSRTVGTTAQNPLYGVDSYLAFGAIWRRTKVYDKGQIPPSILDGLGLIFENPPGDPETPPRRNWLKLGPQSRERGNVTEITDSYLLSGIGGWLPQIYDGSDLS